MALFGGRRDITFFYGLNKELLGDIITQQIALFKTVISQVKTNIYGEQTGNTKRKFYDPILYNVLIDPEDQNWQQQENGPNLKQKITIYFLKEDLITNNQIVEIGDIIEYRNNYYEINTLINNQLFVGKDENNPYNQNPINPQLELFGWDQSVITTAHYVDPSKINIKKSR